MRLSLLGSVAFATSLVLVVGAPTDPVSAADRALVALAERTVAEALEASGTPDRERLAVATEGRTGFGGTPHVNVGPVKHIPVKP